MEGYTKSILQQLPFLFLLFSLSLSLTHTHIHTHTYMFSWSDKAVNYIESPSLSPFLTCPPLLFMNTARWSLGIEMVETIHSTRSFTSLNNDPDPHCDTRQRGNQPHSRHTHVGSGTQ